MVQVRWTKEASEDLKYIHDYLAQYSPAYAHKQTLRIIRAINTLKFFPMIGKKIPDKRDERYRIVDDYYVLYKFVRNIQGVVVVVSVVSSRKEHALR